MSQETEPHVKTVYLGHVNRWVESRSPGYPQEFDPFGKIPAETEFLKPAVQGFRNFFLENLAPCGVGLPEKEGHVNIDLRRTDSTGRSALIVSIEFPQPSSENIDICLIHRFYLYGNNVAIKKIIDHSTIWQNPLP